MRFVLLFGLILPCCTVGEAQNEPSTPRRTAAAPTKADRPADVKSLKQFLRRYDDDPTSPYAKTTRYAAAYVDLRDDGIKEVIVYLMGPNWCGSGGCSCLILQPHGSSFTIVTKTTITQLPIRVLSQKTNGWHDLAVGVRGGGIREGYEARLRFNGQKYAGNPSVAPAEKLQKLAEGKVVIPESAAGTPLY